MLKITSIGQKSLKAMLNMNLLFYNGLNSTLLHKLISTGTINQLEPTMLNKNHLLQSNTITGVNQSNNLLNINQKKSLSKPSLLHLNLNNKPGLTGIYHLKLSFTNTTSNLAHLKLLKNLPHLKNMFTMNQQFKHSSNTHHNQFNGLNGTKVQIQLSIIMMYLLNNLFKKLKNHHLMFNTSNGVSKLNHLDSMNQAQ